jgi:hypothetical protein
MTLNFNTRFINNRQSKGLWTLGATYGSIDPSLFTVWTTQYSVPDRRATFLFVPRLRHPAFTSTYGGEVEQRTSHKLPSWLRPELRRNLWILGLILTCGVVRVQWLLIELSGCDEKTKDIHSFRSFYFYMGGGGFSYLFTGNFMINKFFQHGSCKLLTLTRASQLSIPSSKT